MTISTTSITIRNVRKETRDELAVRAKRSGRSLQEYLRIELEKMADRPDIDELMDRIDERRRRSGATFPSEELVELLHADRR